MLAVCNAEPQLVSLSPDGTYVARPEFRPPTRFERRGDAPRPRRVGFGLQKALAAQPSSDSVTGH